MSKASHTPGPWQAIGTDPAEGGDWFWIMAQPHPAMRGFTKEIGVVNGSQSDPTQVANANLVAAAPELLARLKSERENRDNILRFLLGGHTEMVIEMLQNGGRATDEVIAKAEGRHDV